MSSMSQKVANPQGGWVRQVRLLGWMGWITRSDRLDNGVGHVGQVELQGSTRWMGWIVELDGLLGRLES